ncbi:helix-turn-helix domain-containing protein [Campylobacter sputorum]|uniref:helix-turn-helix domain-containing protein n=1 Tax=Campylobacter sputorum TaxID=206 RepID=UPI00053BEB83|nr:helix-turn-helix domain-containing protein [Campylobacter sputorum]
MSNYDEYTAILKSLTNAKTSKELAQILEIPYRTLTTWQTRGDIPKTRLLEFANKLGVSMDTLLSGSVKLAGNNNIAATGNHNNINSNDLQDAKLKTAEFKEFLELYKRYGSEEMLNDLTSKLKAIEKIIKG